MGVEDSVATLYSENPFFRQAKERAINFPQILLKETTKKSHNEIYVMPSQKQRWKILIFLILIWISWLL